MEFGVNWLFSQFLLVGIGLVYQVFTGQVSILSPIQQCQTTEEKTELISHLFFLLFIYLQAAAFALWLR